MKKFAKFFCFLEMLYLRKVTTQYDKARNCLML